MTKFFTTLLVVSGLCTTAFSQTKGTTTFGVNAGLNLATVTASGQTNSDYRTGFNAGITVEHYLSDSWSIKGEAIYDQKGWNSGYLITTSTNYTTTDYQLDYVTIPVLASWHFGHTSNWYLHFGPYAGILLNAKATALNMDVKSVFNTVDAGLDLGIGVKFPIANHTKFFVEVNGQGGVADMVKGNSGSTIRNSVSAINVGLTF